MPYPNYDIPYEIGKFIVICFISLLILIIIAGVCFAQGVDQTRAVIHHTSSPDWGVEKIRKIHVEENGWDDIGYHFLIRSNGYIEPGRSMLKKGAHAKGRNNYIGIALTGYDKFTDQQIKSLIELIDNLGIKKIERHHELCPGRGLNLEFIKQVTVGEGSQAVVLK